MQVHQIFKRSSACLTLLLGVLAVPAAALADTLDDVAVTAVAADGVSVVVAIPGAAATTAPAAMPHAGRPEGAIASSAPETADASAPSFGAAIAPEGLDEQRGGTDLGSPVPLTGILASGNVSDNRAINVVTGSNSIRDGAFANASGIPVVIQNTGANVLIQSATIVNVQLR